MKLDNQQREAANYLFGHSLIIAGAGSGKTTTLIRKIDNIILKGTNENEILVISYTNETVKNFIKKCKYNIDVMTFHKAALTFINEYYDIADECILEELIERYLKIIPIKMKRKLFHMYNGKYKIYSEEKYIAMIKENNAYSLPKTLLSIIKIVKTNNITIKNFSAKLFNKDEMFLLYCADKINALYNEELENNQLIDFDDMIIIATKNLNNNVIKSKYKYILVDEYQDISKIRLDFLMALAKSNNAIITAVGDDYQSIYRFSGSNIELFYNFQNYFANCKTFFLENTYRCPQKIISKSSKFIMKNKFQLKKNMKSINKYKNCIHKIYSNNGAKTLYKMIKKIEKYKSILILSRNNYDINSFLSNNLKYENDRFYIDNIERNNIRFMSIHKSKGLETDVVIIISLNNKKDGLPCKKESKLLRKILNFNEPIKYPEERRLFYVALTRTKSDVYLIIDKNNPSIFVNEI